MNEKGFTLIEILFAIFIFSIIITIVFGSYNFVFSASDHINEKVEACKMASNCFNKIIEDIESVYIPIHPDYSPPDIDDEPDKHRIAGNISDLHNNEFAKLRFASSEHLSFGENAHNKGIARIVYYVRQKKNNDFVLCRSDDLAFLESFEEKNTDPVLCENLISFSLTYFNEEGEKYDHWDSESEDFSYSTPKAIGIQLEIAYNNRSMFFETTAYLPVFREKIE